MINSLIPGDAWMYLRIVLHVSLVQLMAWCLFGAKPLPELMLTSGSLDPKEQT